MALDSKAAEMWNVFPDEIHEITSVFFDQGWYPVFVGGIVRDYLLTREVGTDFDVELHCFDDEVRSAAAAKDSWNGLQHCLENHYPRVKKVFFSILKVKTNHFALDLSPPRTEYFPSRKKRLHKNFFATLYPRLSYEKAWRRRDFSINAIGLEVRPIGSAKSSPSGPDIRLVDPFGGIGDLHEKRHRSVNPDFAMDPVRYLRAIDMSHRFGFDCGHFLRELNADPELEKAVKLLDWRRYIKNSKGKTLESFFLI